MLQLCPTNCPVLFSPAVELTRLRLPGKLQRLAQEANIKLKASGNSRGLSAGRRSGGRRGRHLQNRVGHTQQEGEDRQAGRKDDDIRSLRTDTRTWCFGITETHTELVGIDSGQGINGA